MQSVNPYTGKSGGAEWFYYYYDKPGSYSVEIPLPPGVLINAVLVGGGGYGGQPGSSGTTSCWDGAIVVQGGGGGGGSAGQVSVTSFVSQGANPITITVGDVNQQSSVVTNSVNLSAAVGAQGYNGISYGCFETTTNKGDGGYGGGSGGGAGGATFGYYHIAYPYYINVYQYSTGGSAGSGIGGGGGGAGVPEGYAITYGGKGGSGISVTFVDGTGTANVGKGGGSGGNGSNKSTLATKGADGPPGSVFLYAYFDGCISPFLYFDPAGTTIYETTSNVQIEGSYTLKGYSIPGYDLCMYWPKTTCHWDNGIWLHCTTDWENWCCCTYIPAVPIVPDLVFEVDANVPITVAVTKEGYLLPTTTPPEEIFSEYILIGACVLHMKVNGVPFTFQLLSETYTVPTQDNIYQPVINLPAYSYSITSAGFKYVATVAMDIEFCGNPETASAWINIPLYITLKITDTITGTTVYSYNWKISCYIVNVT